jgi:hypothetical protein
VRVWLATGHTDMHCGFPGLALKVQEVLKRDPLGGHLSVFRGRRGDLINITQETNWKKWPISTAVAGLRDRAGRHAGLHHGSGGQWPDQVSDQCSHYLLFSATKRAIVCTAPAPAHLRRASQLQRALAAGEQDHRR